MGDEVNLAKSVFHSHLSKGPFQSGVERKRWRIVDDVNWPHALIAVSAPPREKGPSEFIIRFRKLPLN
jgi:hypothetical protein